MHNTGNGISWGRGKGRMVSTGILRCIDKAMESFAANDTESALTHVCIAIDATAKKEHPGKKTGWRCQRFVSDHLDVISAVSFGRLTITDTFMIGLNHPKLPTNSDGLASFEDIVYHVVRCELLHGAALPPIIEFTSNTGMELQKGRLILPKQMVLGLVLAVIGSPANAHLSQATDCTLTYDGRSISRSSLWGDRKAIMSWLRPDRKKDEANS